MLRTVSLVVVLAIAFTGLTPAQSKYTPPLVPGDIEAPAGVKLILVGHAVGTQNYICAPASTATGVDWFFIGPQATIFDDEGPQIMTHYQTRTPSRTTRCTRRGSPRGIRVPSRPQDSAARPIRPTSRRMRLNGCCSR